MNRNTIKFAVLMHPIDDTDRWLTIVVCNEGPTAMLPALTFTHAVTSAMDALNALVTGCLPAPDEVELWTVMDRAETLDWFQDNGLTQLFQRLQAVPADVINISHRVIHATQGQLSA